MKISVTDLASLPPRERILVTAHDLFYSEGIRATGIDKIIEHSSVSKVTFYRQYASKNDLIRAYLYYRHTHWISWFQDSLAKAVSDGSSNVTALLATLRSWFSLADFRGCAFLNAAAELGSSDPEILETVRRHKQDMSEVLEKLFSDDASGVGDLLTQVLDGAIVHAQMGKPIDEVMENLRAVVAKVLAPYSQADRAPY